VSAVANPGFGGTTSPTELELVRFARLVSDNAGLNLGPNRISRLVRQFHHDRPRGSGELFFWHLVHEVGMSETQQAAALVHEDILYAVSGYRDPVPAEAIRNLQRQQRRRY
jgi:hypothetical protein